MGSTPISATPKGENIVSKHFVEITLDGTGYLEGDLVCSEGGCDCCFEAMQAWEEYSFDMLKTDKRCVFAKIPVIIEESSEESWVKVENPEYYQ